MKGFKDFLMRGNLIDLAVAFIIGAAFGEVVKTFTAVIMDLIGKLGAMPNFSSFAPGGVNIGAFLTATVSFVILAFVVYFGIVKPFERIKALTEKKPAEPAAPAAPTSEELLAEIRDLLAKK